MNPFERSGSWARRESVYQAKSQPLSRFLKDYSGNRQASVPRYKEAMSLLEDELKRYRTRGESKIIPRFGDKEDGFGDSNVRDKIYEFLKAEELEGSMRARRTGPAFPTVTHIVDCLLVGLDPIAKHFQEPPGNSEGVRSPVGFTKSPRVDRYPKSVRVDYRSAFPFGDGTTLLTYM
jgi:hypothetical protein